MTTTLTLIPYVSAYNSIALVDDDDDDGAAFQEFCDDLMHVAGVPGCGMLTVQVDDDGFTIASDTEDLAAFTGDRLDVIELLTAMQVRTERRAELTRAATARNEYALEGVSSYGSPIIAPMLDAMADTDRDDCQPDDSDDIPF